MNRRITLFTLAISCTLLVVAQEGEKALQYFEKENYDSALYFVNAALEKNENVSLLKLKGDILSYQNELLPSIEFYSRALAEAELSEVADLSLLSEINSGLAFNYGYLGLYSKAITYQRIGLNYALKIGDKQETSSSYFNMATYSTRLAQYDSAIKFIEKAYLMDLASGDSSAISSDLNSIGFLYGKMEQFEKALDYHQQSITFLRPNEKIKLAMRYNNLGMMEMELEKYRDAEAHLIQSFDLHRELKDSLKMAQRKQNMSTLYNKMGLQQKAIGYIQEAIAYYVHVGNQFNESNARILLSRLFKQNRQLDKALEQVLSARSLAMTSDNLNTLVQCYQLMVELYEENGNAQLALEALKQQMHFEDSLQNNQNLSAISDLELKFVTDQKEKEIELLQINNQLKEANLAKNKRTILLLSIGLLILIVLGFWIIRSQKQKFKLREELLSKEADNLRLQINALLGTGNESIDVGMHEVNDKLKEHLSEREFEILTLAITEKSNREIADELFVSVNTVKFHLKNIYEKLGVSNRKEALQFVIKD